MVIGILSLILLIPVAMIKDLIRERQDRSQEAVLEVSEKWGLAQTVTGPFITIPFREVLQHNGKTDYVYKQMHILPELLEISGDVVPDQKKRGIFKVVVYETDLTIHGHFKLPQQAIEILEEHEGFNKTFFLKLGLSDLRGIKDVVMKINGETIEELPGLPYNDVVGKGIHIPLSGIEPVREELSFKIKLILAGSSNLNFTPLGKTTEVRISSQWADPSFSGSFLPETKEISSDGFDASWNINYLNRNYPQYWLNKAHNLEASEFGVRFLIPVDHYQKSMRSIKYAFMFIALSFLIFFLTELISGIRLHPIQYLLVGVALVIFYTLLISLAEHIGFNLAYVVSSLGTVSLIGLYVRASTGNWRQGLITWALLLVIYAFLFTTLQLQDYSLLFGSVGIFVVVAIIMYVSRKVSWYKESELEQSDLP